MLAVYFVMSGALLAEEKVNQNYNSIDIIYAAEDGDYNGVKYLLDRGVYVDTRDENRSTALMFACRNGDYAMVKLLIDNGAFPKAKNNDGRSVFNYALASETYNIDVIKLLLDKGIDVNNTTDYYSDGALHFAVKHNDIELVKLFIEKGADVNSALRTAIIWDDNIEIVKLLIEEHGADANYVDSKGKSILQFAVGRYPAYDRSDESKEIIKLLKEAGAVKKPKTKK